MGIIFMVSNIKKKVETKFYCWELIWYEAEKMLSVGWLIN